MHYTDTQDKEYGHEINQTFVSPYAPVKISDAMLAFPAEVVGTFLPKWEDIPEDFRRSRNKWTHLVDQWFCNGLKEVPEERPEFDRIEVWRHLKACMGSFQPAHEHKVAGVAYLMSLWLKDIKEKE